MPSCEKTYRKRWENTSFQNDIKGTKIAKTMTKIKSPSKIPFKTEVVRTSCMKSTGKTS